MTLARIMFVVAYVFGQFSVVAFMLAYGVRGVAPWLALVAMAIAAAGLAAT